LNEAPRFHHACRQRGDVVVAGGACADALRRYAVELVALAPDVIFATGSPALGQLQQATGTVPIVFVHVTDPVGSGFIASLAHPGGNMTGFADSEYGMSGKLLELLKLTVPRVTRAAVLRSPDNPADIGAFAAIQSMAPSLGVEVIPIGGRARHRLPAVYPTRYFVTAGGLIYYGPDSVDQYRRAAGYVDRILKGEKPADLPVQAPTKYETVINLKTAKALNLNMPATVLTRADDVIE
jgi:putative ABC transport system substrate-binding protein